MLELIGLREDLVARTAGRVLDLRDGADLSAAAVVYPSKRFGFFLREELADRMEGNFFPPSLFPVEAFFEELFKLNFPGFRTLEDLEAGHALYECCRAEFPEGMYGHKAFTDFVSFLPWAGPLRAALEEILTEAGRIEGIDFAGYEAFTGMGEYHPSYKKLIESLPRLLAGFRRLLEGRKQATAGMVFRMIAERAEKDDLIAPPARNWIFSGFNAMNVCERALFRFFRDRFDARLILRTDPERMNDPFSPFHLQAETLRAVGLSPDAAFSSPGGGDGEEGKVSLHSCDGVESEALEAFRILESICRGREEGELRRIAVLLPASPTLLPFVQGTVSRFDHDAGPVPFNITLGYPMERTPIMQLVDSILTVFENGREGRIAAADYLRLIRHPYVKISGSGGDIEPLKRGIHLLEDGISRRNLAVFTLDELMEEMSESPGTSIRLEIEDMHRRFIPLGIESLGGLLTFLRGALESVGVERNRTAHLFLNEYAVAALEALAELEEFVGNHPADFRAADPAGMAALVRAHFRGRTIRFEGSPLQGVQVMGPLEFRGLSFDDVIVLDALEGVLPGTSKHDPILPADVRRLFGMRDHGDKGKVTAFNFFAMLGAAGRVRILYPRQSEDGKPSERSRFIERLIYEAGKKKTEAPKEERVLLPYDLTKQGLTRVPKDERIRERIASLTLSPSSLETYVKCPLQFYYGRILRLKEREEVAEETDGGMIGEIAHAALSRFYQIHRRLHPPGKEERATMDQELAGFLAEAYRTRHLDPGKGLERIRSWVLSKQLDEFLDLDWRRTGVRVEDCEKERSFNLKVNGLKQGVLFKGRIDREETEEGIKRVIDYKTGAPFPSRVRTDDLLDLKDLARRPDAEYFAALKAFRKKYPAMQLLIYLLFLLSEEEQNAGLFDAAYVFLREKSADMMKGVFWTGRGKNARLLEPEEKRAVLRVFSSDLEEIVRDIHLREEFLPNPSDERVCGYCPFRLPCGNL